MVVLPAASNPTIRIRICFLAKSRDIRFEIVSPMFCTDCVRLGYKKLRARNKVTYREVVLSFLFLSAAKKWLVLEMKRLG